MFTFGKKLSFRPLIISLLYFFVFGLIAGGFLGLGGWLAGLIAMLLVAGVHYPGVLEVEFNYFEVTDSQIKYYDFSSWWKRFLMIFMGPFTPLQSIDLTEIADARAIGRRKGKELQTAIPYPNALVGYTGLLSSIQNLYWIEITFKNGQKKKFSLARDKAYDTEKTINKANSAVDWIRASK